MRPGELLVGLVQEREHAHDAAAGLTLKVVVAGRQRAGADLGDVGQTATRHRVSPALVGVHDLFSALELDVEDRELTLVDRIDGATGDEFPGTDRDHDVRERSGEDVNEQGAQPPLDRVPGLVGEHLGLGRLLEPVVAEAGRRREYAGALEDLQSLLEFGRRHGVQRVGGCGAAAHLSAVACRGHALGLQLVGLVGRDRWPQ